MKCHQLAPNINPVSSCSDIKHRNDRISNIYRVICLIDNIYDKNKTNHSNIYDSNQYNKHREEILKFVYLFFVIIHNIHRIYLLGLHEYSLFPPFTLLCTTHINDAKIATQNKEPMFYSLYFDGINTNVLLHVSHIAIYFKFE